MKQIDAVAVFTDQHHADGKAAQIESGEVRVFLQRGKPADQPRQQRHQHPRRKSADTHRGQAQSRRHIADGRPGQHRMAQSVADQAHAAHHQKHAHRRGTERQENDRRQRITHKVKFDKGGNNQIVEIHREFSQRNETGGCRVSDKKAV